MGSASEAAKNIIGMLFPDKIEENKAEAQSSDLLQQWRGDPGCVSRSKEHREPSAG